LVEKLDLKLILKMKQWLQQFSLLNTLVLFLLFLLFYIMKTHPPIVFTLYGVKTL